MKENQKAVELFTFLKEYNNIKNPVITDIKNQVWYRWMDNITENKYIVNNIYCDNYSENLIFSVDKPDRTQCPEPPNSIKEWLKKGWNKFDKEPEIIEVRVIKSLAKDKVGKEVEVEKTEHFEDDIQRQKDYKEWLKLRTKWQEYEKEADEAEKIFNELYTLYASIKKDSESIELLIGDAILYSNSKKKIKHPILNQVINIEFDANIPQFKLCEGDKGPELYKNLFGYIDDYNHEIVSSIYNEFEEELYLPYEKEISNGFLNRLVHGLSPRGEFHECEEEIKLLEEYPQIYRRPVIFTRKRNLGFGVAIDSILEELEYDLELPEFINDVIGIENKGSKEGINENKEISSSLASNGVDEEVLLTKPANLEQLSVAKHLKRNSAVLVQGPPGTGKTHTISNVIGHLLAEGKSILVTSYSEKALAVLKDKVDEKLQSLCLSLLSGVDNRKEMERTLDEINANRANLEISTLSTKINSLEKERKNIIEKLTELGRDFKNARLSEYRNIVLGGQEFSPKEAAIFIKNNKNALRKLPTPIKLGEILTLSQNEMQELYASNIAITEEEEKEYSSNIPDVSELVEPKKFEEIIREKNKFDQDKLELGNNLWKFDLENYEIETLEELITDINEVVKYIDLDNKMVLESIEVSREDDKTLWESLIKDIEDVYQLYLKNSEFILKYNPKIENIDKVDDVEKTLEEIIAKLKSNGKIGYFTTLLNKSIKIMIDSCKVNGKAANSVEEFEGIKEFYIYSNKQKQLMTRWDRQVGSLGVEKSDILGDLFDKKVKMYGDIIKGNLEWYDNQWNRLINKLTEKGIDTTKITLNIDTLKDRYANLRYIKEELNNKLQSLIKAQIYRIKFNEIKQNKDKLERILKEKCENSSSVILNKLKNSVIEEDVRAYEECYYAILEIKNMSKDIERRYELIGKLKIVAPEWAKLIENRVDEFGNGECPANINDCWKFTQFIEELDLRNKVSIDKIQTEIGNLEKVLRNNTSALAFNKAWFYMLEKLSDNKSQIQAIEGWRQLIRKIGAGKGKNAEKYKNEARKLMPKCQGAVPVWIMPLNKVVENFNLKENKFDVVIIDEASQADMMAIVALYLGKKVIIVGDNEQVSPLAIGEKTDEMDRLVKEFLHDIPNNALYSGRFSIYDLAQASGYQPVRLKEHFRCVPEIIQFSNMLSYNNQIKALRETSNIKTKPPIVTYKVENSHCENKINMKEAEIVTSLILACCQKEEYDGKTFGVITLRGEKQAVIIDKMLREKMEPKEYDNRNILCGNSAQFQGDERDIIFITMVDANDKVGPMRLVSYGTEDSNKKRYNVAVSRAKDQLWVIHSLDSENDLKNGDIRKELLDYCNNYKSRQIEFEKNVVNAESEFEKRVMKYLIERGYNITPQWEVGAYRIDMVVSCGNNRIALECDGEKWHGDDKLEEDMNRQSILERLGWRFIRIRGSEFFRDEEGTMKKVICKLNSTDIFPEQSDKIKDEDEEKFISSIKSNALIIRENWKEE